MHFSAGKKVITSYNLFRESIDITRCDFSETESSAHENPSITLRWLLYQILYLTWVQDQFEMQKSTITKLSTCTSNTRI